MRNGGGDKRGLVEGRDVPWLFRQWVGRNPQKDFLIWEPSEGEARSWTYAEFFRDASRVANGLDERGVGPGARVLIHLENSPEFLIAWAACALIGAVAVCTNTRSVAAEMEYFIRHTQIEAAVTQESLLPTIINEVWRMRFIAVVGRDSSDPSVDASVKADYIIRFGELFSELSELSLRETDPHRDLAIQFTSGTTGRSKAVVFTHANAIWAAQANAANFKMDSGDITLVQLPLYHINALSYLVWTTLWVGGTVVLQPKVSVSTFWEISVRRKCTVASVLAFAAQILRAQPVPAHDYRLWIFGVSYPELEQIFRVRFLPFWGMTETVSAGIVGDLSHPGPFMCIGRQAPGYEIKIVAAHGAPAAPGEQGQLFVRGDRGVTMFREYLDDDAANQDAFDDAGWFDTGDLVRLDHDGNIYFSDRLKDVIRVGGENVSASEVEWVISATGLVKECAVVAREHPVLGEVPVAFVVSDSLDIDHLSRHVMDACARNLADFKNPKDIMIVQKLPRNTLGKVDKKYLRSVLVGSV